MDIAVVYLAAKRRSKPARIDSVSRSSAGGVEMGFLQFRLSEVPNPGLFMKSLYHYYIYIP